MSSGGEWDNILLIFAYLWRNLQVGNLFNDEHQSQREQIYTQRAKDNEGVHDWIVLCDWKATNPGSNVSNIVHPDLNNTNSKLTKYRFVLLSDQDLLALCKLKYDYQDDILVYQSRQL